MKSGKCDSSFFCLLQLFNAGAETTNNHANKIMNRQTLSMRFTTLSALLLLSLSSYGQWTPSGSNTYFNSGNVGIGTMPSAKLHISGGDMLLQNSGSGYPSLYFKDVSGSNSLKFDYNSIIHSGGHMYLRSGSGGNLLINDAAGTGGNVGIGTSSPDAKLTVKGQVHAQEVKVDLGGALAPDYVFAKEYKLQSLEEIKAFIEKNRHLPEVPSAKEMEADGINLGEMNLLLLKKVEELTLYILQQERRIKSLEKSSKK